MVDVSLLARVLANRSLRCYSHLSFSLLLLARTPYDRRRAKRREIAAALRQVRGRDRAMAVAGTAVHVRLERRRRRPSTGVVRET